MPYITEVEAYRACRTLFGPELQLNRDFLAYLQPSGVRSAYREKAKIIHPDCFATADSAIKSRQQKLFQDLNQAHQTVQRYLKQKRLTAKSGCPRHRPSYSQNHRQYRETPQQRPWSQHPLPTRPLQFGMFLYYLGIIPFHALISALAKQRQQRPVLGEIARRWGWLNEEEISRIIALPGGINKFGERAEQLGLLSSLQVRVLLHHQRTKQGQLGDYFVAQGVFGEARKNQLLTQLAEHNRTYRKGFGSYYYFFHR
jgi:hypothetical protein